MTYYIKTIGIRNHPISIFEGRFQKMLLSHMCFANTEGKVQNIRKGDKFIVYCIITGEDSWNQIKTADNVQFTTGGLDGTIEMAGIGCHSCAQRDLTMTKKTSKVEGTHTIELSDFRIITP